MIKYINFNVFKKYFLLIVVALLIFFVFVYLEKNDKNHTFILNTDNQLTSESLHVLSQVEGERIVLFEVYTHPDSSVAKKINRFFKPYLRANNKLKIQFLDPITHSNEVKINGISMQGEIVIRFKNSESVAKINVTELSESSIINGILYLLNQKDEWLVIAEGFGMATIDDESEQGLTALLNHLKKIGFKVARMPLNKAIVLPEKVKAIILPAPTEELDLEIVQWLKSQTENGIGVWWLNDVDVKSQINLELVFDILNSGKLQLEKNQYTSYFSTFANNPITENFNQPIYIAQAREIIADGFIPLFINTEKTSFAVTKQLENSRFVITGDSDFIRNQYINIAANKSMVIRIVDWLLYHDERVNIPVKININTQLLLSQNQLLGFSLFFLIVVPLFYIVFGIVQWRKGHEK